MATLDLISILGNDPSNQTISAYLTPNNAFSPQSGTLLAATSHPNFNDANGNNFDLQFVLTADQTIAFQAGNEYIVVYNQSQNEQLIFTGSGGSSSAANGINGNLTQTTFNTTGPAGMNGTNGTRAVSDQVGS